MSYCTTRYRQTLNCYDYFYCYYFYYYLFYTIDAVAVAATVIYLIFFFLGKAVSTFWTSFVDGGGGGNFSFASWG